MTETTATSHIPSSRTGRAMIAAIRITLGAMFVAIVGDNLNKSLYSADGAAGLLRFYQRTGSAPGVWKDLMGFVANNTAVFGPLQLALELTLGILLLAGFATRPVGLIAAGHLTILWISEIGVPNEWVWSLVFPILAAVTVAVLSAGRVYGLDAVLLKRAPLSRLPRWAVG